MRRVRAPGVLTNNTDPDGDPLTARGRRARPRHGTLRLDPDGSFTSRLDLLFPLGGGTDTFT